MPPLDPQPAGLAQLLVLSHVRDSEGRPILESKSPLLTSSELERDRQTCPFERSPSRYRHTKPMNSAALDQVREHFGTFLELIGCLRRLRQELVGGRPLRLEDWHRICLYGEVLPRWLLLSGHEQRGASLANFQAQRVPVEVGILFKTVRGLLRLTRLMREQPQQVLARLPAARRRALGLDRVPRHRPKKSVATDAPFVYDRAEAGRAFASTPFEVLDLIWITETFELLVGDQEVCAAPPGMIQATLAALVDSPRIDRPAVSSPELTAALGNPAAFDHFAAALEQVYAELAVLRAKAAQRLGEARALLTASSDPNTHLVPVLERYIQDERRFLSRVLPLQARALQAAGCRVTDPPLDERLIDSLVSPHLRGEAQRLYAIQCRHLREHAELRLPPGPSRQVGGPL